jgi:hypothetical protein
VQQKVSQKLEVGYGVKNNNAKKPDIPSRFHSSRRLLHADIRCFNFMEISNNKLRIKEP